MTQTITHRAGTIFLPPGTNWIPFLLAAEILADAIDFQEGSSDDGYTRRVFFLNGMMANAVNGVLPIHNPLTKEVTPVLQDYPPAQFFSATVLDVEHFIAMAHGRKVKVVVGAPENTSASPTVQQAIEPYIAEVMRRHPAWTAEDVEMECMRKAGTEESPFFKTDKGLFSMEAGKTCGIKTIQAVMTKIRKSRASPTGRP